ncbi:MAG TPA: DnaJ domain-containing protein [bacterium]|nr:DnaJ domain-containing protein [bacterium]
MSYRIGIYLKDEKYLKALHDFLSQKATGAEVIALRSLKEFTDQQEGSFRLIIVSTLLNEGLWLRVIPILKKAPHIILLAFPDGPEITEDMAKKYGADRLFRVPFSSGDLLASIQQILAADEQAAEQDQIQPDTLEAMKNLYARLEEMDYYQMFNVEKNSDVDTIKKSYIEMARQNHPDRFRNANPEARKMAYEITKRANEAYSVLSHPNRRKMYEKMQKENPDTKRFDFRLKMKYEENPHDTIHNQQARRFALLAQKAMNEGSFKQALTQLKMANSMEPGNDYILGLMDEVQKKLAAG